jgi:uncharacterized protein (DUF2126 family)
VERRDGTLFVFLPPTATAQEFLALVGAVDAARRATGLDVQLEGYPPPSSPLLSRLAVTPDPGVLEVNLPPLTSGRSHAAILDTVFEAGLHAGLHSEKWLLDGRLAGSGGGHHVTVGGPTPLTSPLVRRPDLVASLVTFAQHHPSLSYLFSGLFVGPTSQAPRVDEARLETLSELEIALAHAFTAKAPDPWLGDLLFRNLLTDLTGNTHRTELSIDKLWDWRTAHGRQGVVEFRAFEMPPHPRLAAAQALLVRSLVAAFSKRPYQRPLIRWGAALHDRFMPHSSGATSRRCWPSSDSAACRSRPSPTGPSWSCAARWPGGSRWTARCWRCATPSSPGTCWARSRPAAAPPATWTPRWSGSRCGPTACCPSATRCW